MGDQDGLAPTYQSRLVLAQAGWRSAHHSKGNGCDLQAVVADTTQVSTAGNINGMIRGTVALLAVSSVFDYLYTVTPAMAPDVNWFGD